MHACHEWFSAHVVSWDLRFTGCSATASLHDTGTEDAAVVHPCPATLGFRGRPDPDQTGLGPGIPNTGCADEAACGFQGFGFIGFLRVTGF